MIYAMHIVGIVVLVCTAMITGLFIGGVLRKWHVEEKAGHKHRFIHLVDPFSEVTKGGPEIESSDEG